MNVCHPVSRLSPVLVPEIRKPNQGSATQERFRHILERFKNTLINGQSAELQSTICSMINWGKTPLLQTINRVNSLVYNYLNNAKKPEINKILELFPLLIKYNSIEMLKQCALILQKEYLIKISYKEIRSDTCLNIIADANSDLNCLKSLIDKCGPHVHILDLKNIKIQTHELEEITKKTPNLYRLSMSRNEIQSLGHALAPLQQLKVLELPFCSSLENLPDLACLIRLQILDLACCTALLKIDVSYLASLKTLYAYSCEALKDLNLSGCINLENFFAWNCYQLTSINFTGCQAIKKLDFNFRSKIETINLRNCTGLTSLVVENHLNLTTLSWGGCSSLKEIKISYCQKLTWIHYLSDCIELESLSISECPSISVLPDLSKLQKLQKLVLSNCNMLTLFRISECQNLQTIDIKQCFNLTWNTVLDVRYLLEKRLMELNEKPNMQIDRALALSVLESWQSLYITGDDDIYKKAFAIELETRPENLNQRKNPYRLYAMLTNLKEKPAVVVLKRSIIGDEEVRWNLPFLRKRARCHAYKVRDLPEDFTKETLNDLIREVDSQFEFINEMILQEIFELQEGNTELHEKYNQSLLKDWHPLKTSFFDSTIQHMLIIGTNNDETLTDSQFHLFSILHAIKKMDNEKKAGDLLSKRHNAVLALFSSVQACVTGKKDGLSQLFHIYVSKGEITDPVAHRGSGCEIDLKIATGMAWIDSLFQELLEHVLSRDGDLEQSGSMGSLLRRLQVIDGNSAVYQGSHQTTFLKNRFHHQIGFKQNGIKFDLHAGTLYDQLVELKPIKFLHAFFEECTPEQLVRMILKAANEPDNSKYNQIWGWINDLLLGCNENPQDHYLSDDEGMSFTLKKESALFLLSAYGYIDTRKKTNPKKRSIGTTAAALRKKQKGRMV
jgi:Leucine-rich repeat (LRR) protein